MAAHHTVVATLQIQINPEAFPPKGRRANILLPGGTAGTLKVVGSAGNPWDVEKLYRFTPNGFVDVNGTPINLPTVSVAVAGGAKSVVLLEDVLYSPTSEKIMTVAIAEAGFMRIRDVEIDSAAVLPLDRCKLVVDQNKFKLIPLGNTDGESVDANWFTGRLLTSSPAESPLLFSDYNGRYDIEFFRQRPIKNPVRFSAAGSLASGGSLGGGVYVNPGSDSDDY